MATRRGPILAATAAVGVLLVMASAAWACTEFLKIEAVAPASSVPGPTATVRGSGAVAGAVVDIRWNAENGPVVGRATADPSGGFSVDASIPSAAPAGVYVLIASDGKTPVGRAAYR